jgi:hypoxanthine phosphoribosyltransferase
MDFLRVSWDEASRMCELLASEISSSGFRPDVVIGISRGGLVPARLLSDIMGVNDICVMGVSFYQGIGKTAKAPAVTQPLPIRLEGKKALLADDVSDSGRSLMVAREHVLGMGAGEVKVATMHFKPHSSFKPDFFVAETGAWIVYPWELHECERELGKKMPE